MINTFVALMVELELLTALEGEALADKLLGATLPHDFKTAHTQVKEFLKDVRDGK